MSKAHMHALHSGHSGRLFAGASSLFLFLLSLPFLLLLFSLSSLLLSPFCFQKPGRPIWESARQESSHADGMEGA
jgi:hypothetical protein